MRTITYIIMGYIMGSILFAQVFSKLFNKNILQESKDGNPGTANAFMYGGFWFGVLTLFFELFKGAVPVYLYLRGVNIQSASTAALASVIAAPVIGHIYPIFNKFHGGKGIAVTFGVLLGLVPIWSPVLLLAFFFIFFSMIVRVSPHIHRTVVTYCCTLTAIVLTNQIRGIIAGVTIITVIVLHRLYISKEEKEKIKVGLLWMN